jgi:uncharacterized membrane protein (DUF373 family)
MEPAMNARGPANSMTADIFGIVETIVYAGLGGLLSITALLALGAAGMHVWQALSDWSTNTAIFAVIERLLLVFMLIEILHTIRASMQSHTLTCEPFLIVALIASVRRMLVITLQSTEVAHDAAWTLERETIFRSTMLELGVLGALTVVMVLSIALLRHSRRVSEGQVRRQRASL